MAALTEAAAPAASGFQVKLANFTGPFDLLLQLIGKHKLDVTEVALHTVTDDFIAYIRAMGDDWDLDEASEFLVVAATLLDLKAARLLPSATVENEEDLALLEARDLLFARLLQYKAFKEAAAHIAGLEAVGSRRYPRSVTLEPRFAEALPDLVLGVGPQRLLKLALKAFTPKVPPVVSIAHIHQVRVSVREHANIMKDRLMRLRVATFTDLCNDCESTLEVVARFLALLELYRENLVSFEQVQALGELVVRWTAADDADVNIDVEEYDGRPAPADAPPPSDGTTPPDEALDADSAGASQSSLDPAESSLDPAEADGLEPDAAAEAELEASAETASAPDGDLDPDSPPDPDLADSPDALDASQPSRDGNAAIDAVNADNEVDE
ncbi:segregation and condensation protein A [Dactylosporangium sp. CA-139066]|uniref:segregation and condensation protein A n=1 Tax=Dactylosporangium sp. CA-139066 TaxID=3239930 RepID=UPI003D8E0ECD